MPGWKAHTNFGLFAYGVYFLCTLLNPYSAAAALLCVPVAMFGALFPDKLDPPTGRKHRARAHSKQRLEKYFKVSLIVFPVSLLIPFAVPVMAYLIGYISHLVADSTTPSGLPSYPDPPADGSGGQAPGSAAVSAGPYYENEVRGLRVVCHENNHDPGKQEMLQNLLRQARQAPVAGSRAYLLHTACWKRLSKPGNQAKLRFVRLRPQDIAPCSLPRVAAELQRRWTAAGNGGEIDQTPLYLTDRNMEFIKKVRQTKIEEFSMR